MKTKFESCEKCKECGTLFPKHELNRERRLCRQCDMEQKEEQQNAVKRADNHAFANLARTLLGELSGKSKGEPTSPQVLASVMKRLGGPEAFGEIVADQLNTAIGKEIPAELQPHWKYSPQAAFKWAELITRLAIKDDERESINVENLSQEELLANLQSLALDLTQSSPEFRQMMVTIAIANDPKLVHTAMDAAGMKAVDGQAQEVGDSDELDYEEGS